MAEDEGNPSNPAASSEQIAHETSVILKRIAKWTNSEDEARMWFVTFQIPAFGNLTAEQLVQNGKAAALKTYLECMDPGSFQ